MLLVSYGYLAEIPDLSVSVLLKQFYGYLKFD